MTSATAEKYYLELKLAVGAAGQTETIAAVARRFQVSDKFARYHIEKFSDPTFHANAWGGARNVSFSQEEQLVLEVWIILFCNLQAFVCSCCSWRKCA